MRSVSLSAMLANSGIEFTHLSHSAMVELSFRSSTTATLSTAFNFALPH